MRDFNHTVNVLVKAYLNDTLRHGNCAACAVGNIIADSIGVKYCTNKFGDLWWSGVNPNWFDIVWLSEEDKAHQEHFSQAAATGYSNDEILRIERAFESCALGMPKDPDGFLGLMKVVDVLADIHGINLEAREEAKLLFVKQ